MQQKKFFFFRVLDENFDLYFKLENFSLSLSLKKKKFISIYIFLFHNNQLMRIYIYQYHNDYHTESLLNKI